MARPGSLWTAEQLETDRLTSLELFRQERMKEPLEAYLQAFDKYRSAVEKLLQITGDLLKITSLAADVLAEPLLLDAVRYLAGPPISLDDLRVLSEASLAPAKIRADPALARRIVETVLLGLDRSRFPWVREGREPSDAERSAGGGSHYLLGIVGLGFVRPYRQSVSCNHRKYCLSWDRKEEPSR